MLNVVAPGLWEATQPLRVAGFELGHRMTVIRLNSGELVIHSPIQFSSPVMKDVEALGPVQHVLAPSSMHDLYLTDWMRAFPGATLHHSPALRVSGVDSDRAKPLARGALGDLEIIPVEGMPKIQEFVVLHPPSATLIVCDLVFNLPPGKGFQKVFQKLNGIYEQLGPSRIFKASISHDAAFRASVQEILALKFDRLIVGHGSNVSTEAKLHLRRAFAWLRLADGHSRS